MSWVYGEKISYVRGYCHFNGFYFAHNGEWEGLTTLSVIVLSSGMTLTWNDSDILGEILMAKSVTCT